MSTQKLAEEVVQLDACLDELKLIHTQFDATLKRDKQTKHAKRLLKGMDCLIASMKRVSGHQRILGFDEMEDPEIKKTFEFIKDARLELWAVINREKTRPTTQLQYDAHNNLAYARRDHINQLRAMGMDFVTATRDYNRTAKEARVQFAEDMKKLREQAEQDAYYAPSNLHLLDGMFKYDKKEKKRHFDKD